MLKRLPGDGLDMKTSSETGHSQSAVIVNIQGFSIHDGPGIRTVVFFKGCPLSCRWCANPECLSPSPQMGFMENLCSGCGSCLEICPNNALVLEQGKHRIDYSRCRACGDCRLRCYNGALTRYGELMSLAQVWDAVQRDRIFYEGSGGGVTASGGEPLLQSDFVADLFSLCREQGLSTCIETCGFVPEGAFLRVLPYTDLFLFDLKLMDTEEHKRYTGQSNEQILRNARLLIEHDAHVLFRQPLIPGVNDAAGNIEATARFLNALGPGASKLELMPFHRLGLPKYKALNIPYTMGDVAGIDDEQSEATKDLYTHYGIDCSISR